MNASVTTDFSDLHKIMAQSPQMANKCAKTVLRTQNRFSEFMVAEASRRAPLGETGHLRRSGWQVTALVPNGVLSQIMFGGIVAAYAEVQHENERAVHDEAGYVAKYHRPLSRKMTIRKYNQLKGSISKKTGKISIRSVLAVRRRRHRDGTPYSLGYFGGQAHFLYGRSTSAWTPARERQLIRQVVIDIERMAAKEMGR